MGPFSLQMQAARQGAPQTLPGTGGMPSRHQLHGWTQSSHKKRAGHASNATTTTDLAPVAVLCLLRGG